MYRSVDRCRVCRSKELTNVLSLGEQSLTGVFTSTAFEKITSGPLDLVMCTAQGGCGLVQLLQSYDLGEMYGDNYGYRSSLNASMVAHLQQKVQKILDMGILEPGDAIIDIGSNDATTLKTYPRDVYDLIGIDPTGEKFAQHYPSYIRLISDFFSAESSFRALGNRRAKVITSFSMFYDLEDPVSFAMEVAAALDEQGIWVLEQSYLPSMLLSNSFDTICHEHLEFYGLRQIKWITSKAGLRILDVEFNDVNGGSFSIVVGKIGSAYTPNKEKIESIIEDEIMLGLDTPRAFDEFKIRIAKAREELLFFLHEAASSGKVVCGLGASTKGNVLLQYFNIGPSLIKEIGEVNSDKFGRFTPGTGIPLVSEDDVLASEPDYLVIFPWHFRAFFENSEKMRGRRVVFPLPKFELVKL
jgi:C-methyltransferase C-terminal domain/Putative zinc binding domain/Methyltransferase domain